MSELPHILVVDDDKRLRELLRRYLVANGFRVTTATDATNARATLKGMTFDLIVLDVMMPGESGLDLTRALRAESGVPILLLTAMAESEERIAGLESGADDYLTKPFEPRELVLRIQTILRRAPAPPPVVRSDIALGEFRFDLRRETLYRGDRPIRLTTAETRLLKALATRPGEPVSRDQLAVETGARLTSRTVDVQVTRLRRKIEPDPRTPRYLQTIRGQGYVLWPD
ncbi:MAG TPA: response regulator [Alphaproteobacteria bacterium]|jgi:two-component system phosphate regulon response regulator OmpR